MKWSGSASGADWRIIETLPLPFSWQYEYGYGPLGEKTQTTSLR